MKLLSWNVNGIRAAAKKGFLQFLEKENPDIILMDLSLPVLDGWGATRKLKSDASTKDIPIIALSAHAMEEHKSKTNV